MPELRKDPIVDRWVIIASERARRPNAFVVSPPWEPSEPCPFCEGREADTPAETFALRETGTAANSPGWRVRVVPNKFPSLVPREGLIDPRSEGIFTAMDGVGAHEIIVECPRHVGAAGQMTPQGQAEVLLACRQRLLFWRRDRRFRYGLIFKNTGIAAGASMEHAHSQLIVTPTMPGAVREEMDAAEQFFRRSGRCIWCEMISQELAGGSRVVLQSPRIVAFAPFASRLPYETWIVPRGHSSHFEQSPDDLLAELAAVVQSVLARIERASVRPAYNYFLHTSPFDTPELAHYHWHIEIIPALAQAAGFEWGSGCYVNPVSPEDAAAFLRS